MRDERLDRLRAIVRARRATHPRAGRSTALGLVLVLMAVGFAFYWQPLPRPGLSADIGARRHRPGDGPILLAPQGETAVCDRIAWRWSEAPRAWSVRVLDAEFGEIARLGPTPAGATSLRLPDEVRRRLKPGLLYHWVVEAGEGSDVVRSRVASFSLQPASPPPATPPSLGR